MSRRKNEALFEPFGVSARERAIAEWLPSAQDRRIMTRALVIHDTYAAIAEAEGMTEKQIARRIHRAEDILYKHM